MRRSEAHEYRQAYNAQAVVCAEGSQLVLEIGVVATTADAPGFAATILGMEKRIGLPRTVLADTGFASGKAIGTLQASGVDPLVAIGRPLDRRSYDFRAEPPPRASRRITEPWRLEMKARLQQNPAKALYASRPSNRFSASSRAAWASSASISVASPTSQPNGRLSPSHTTAAGSRD